MTIEYPPDAKINPLWPVSPYRQLAAILKARIQRGDWAPERPIPSEQQLVGEYGLARSTVRRTIKVLVDDGVVFVVPQRGTYVTGKLVPTGAAATYINEPYEKLWRWWRSGLVEPDEVTHGGQARWNVTELRKQVRKLRNGEAEPDD